MGVDIAHRFGISEAHVSRIWASWLEFLYHELGALPSGHHMIIYNKLCRCCHSLSKKTYPNTCVIIDCTEQQIEMPCSSFRSQSAFLKMGTSPIPNDVG
jgi:hypothetical protein